MTAYTLDVVIALGEAEAPSADWWLERFGRGIIRMDGIPPEVDPVAVTLTEETDPETAERYGRVTLPLAPGTTAGRANELAHLLTSALTAVGYTLRENDRTVDTPPGEPNGGEPDGTLGSTEYGQAHVRSDRCLSCVLSSEHTRIGCCTEGAAFSLADIGSALLVGDEEFAAKVLAMAGEQDGEKWHLHLREGACVFHSPERGCTLPRHQMPMQCRTYLCLPEHLLPAQALGEYETYVDALDEQEDFVGDHMRHESHVTFASPLAQLKAAAARAFAAWRAESEEQ